MTVFAVSMFEEKVCSRHLLASGDVMLSLKLLAAGCDGTCASLFAHH